MMEKQTVTFRYDVTKLAKRKIDLGLTDLELARRCRLHPSTIKNVLTGKTCKPPTIRTISEALGLDLDGLVVSENQQLKEGAA